MAIFDEEDFEVQQAIAESIDDESDSMSEEEEDEEVDGESHSESCSLENSAMMSPYRKLLDTDLKIACESDRHIFAVIKDGRVIPAKVLARLPSGKYCFSAEDQLPRKTFSASAQEQK